MTKILLIVNEELANIYCEVLDHSEDHDTCTIVSTLTNVMIAEAMRAGVEPRLNGPSVKIIIDDADEKTLEVFQVVKQVLKEAEKQNKRHMKMY